jgi:hypothetical protein
MRQHISRAVCVAALLVAGCSGEGITGLDQAVYNATYSGPAWYPTVQIGADMMLIPTGDRLTMTLSQLGRDFTGTFTISDSLGGAVYAGSVRGRTTNTGGDITFVIPPPCGGVLYGSFSVSGGQLNGRAVGRDCTSQGENPEKALTFTNLARE